MPHNQQDGGSRPVDARKLLNVLRATKSQQDLTAQPSRGRGLWLSSKLWHAITKHLEQQASEVEALKQDLLQRDQEAEQLRQQAAVERQEQQRVIALLQAQAEQLQAQVEHPLAELGSLQAQMRAKQEAWDNQRQDLESQMDRLMDLLRKMGLLAEDEGQHRAPAVGQGLKGTVADLSRGHEYSMGKAGSGVTAPDAQALHIRELGMLLAESRHQVNRYRRQLAARSAPAEEFTYEIKRVRADNQRLVALLASVPEYRAMAAEVAAENGVHYLPLEECLMIRGLVEDLHPQLLDRPVEELAGSDLAGAGRRRDPDGTDPSLTVVLDEQYHWVPRKALETGAALMRRMMPALPMSQLLVLVAEINKVWRDRERQRLAEVAAAHREELLQLQQTFQQRAPYEAVVAGQKVTDLKRRMRAQAAQAAAAATLAKGEQRRIEEDSKVMLHAGLSSIQDLSRQVARLVTRNKKLAGKAAKQRPPAPHQPICSSCLNRLLLPGPNELGRMLGRAPGLDRQPEQQQPLNLAAAGAAHQGMAASQQLGPSAAQGHTSNAGALTDNNRHHRQDDREQTSEYDIQWWPGPDEVHGRPDSEAASGGWSFRGSGLAQATEPHSTGTLVRVNVLPPPASPSVWRPRDAAASAPAAGTPTRQGGMSTAASEPLEQHEDGGAVSLGGGGDLQGPGTLHLESTLAGLSITTSGATIVHESPGGGRGRGGTTVEVSTASLADWRGGAGRAASDVAASGPVTLRVHVPGASPPRSALGRSSTVSGNDGGSSTAAGGAVVQAQRRGAPVRVCLRFPRQDLASGPQAQ